VTSRSGSNSGTASQAWVRALERTARIEREPHITLPVLIERLAVTTPRAPALVSPESTLDYGALSAQINRYSRWAIGQGLGARDVVCLDMANCAAYLAVWLGLTRVGVTVALLNTNLSGDGLAHAIRIVNPTQLIAGTDLAPAVAAIRGQLPVRLRCWVDGASATDFDSLPEDLAGRPDAPPAAGEFAPPTIDARALYIYTSGTTGLPKAAIVSHYRLMQWSQWFAGLMDTRANDRMYNCLPLYHSVGGVVATGATLVSGGAVVLRPRFSVSGFWTDVRDQRCTLFQYIGELCRYLVNAPVHAAEREHSLRLACGNGLRPEVWPEFARRSGIPRILEYYAATEGNFSLYNCEGEPGAIGRIPAFLGHRLPVALVRFDVERGEPSRNVDGFCQRCDADEVGEAIGLVPGSGSRTGRFEGYVDPEASARKLLRNVFKAGDTWYRTGDLMRRDSRGFYYFVDRVGDTFRWKGENVSTSEVLAELCACDGVIDGVVYGVAVPGADGRAGMAALIVAPDFDLSRFRAQAATRLPDYARPVFVRLLAQLEATGTFKPKKQDLATAGFDPTLVSDPVYFDDRRRQELVAVDATLCGAIRAGQVRL
jgi:fatty-acyl-CoA synthase